MCHFWRNKLLIVISKQVIPLTEKYDCYKRSTSLSNCPPPPHLPFLVWFDSRERTECLHIICPTVTFSFFLGTFNFIVVCSFALTSFRGPCKSSTSKSAVQVAYPQQPLNEPLQLPPHSSSWPYDHLQVPVCGYVVVNDRMFQVHWPVFGFAFVQVHQTHLADLIMIIRMMV